jgi:N-acetylmuramoyl-L-alanine amidase
MSRAVDLIVIHCSASPDGVSLFEGAVGESSFRTPVQRIDAWHAARGFERNPNWANFFNPELRSIGYHFVIYTNGAIATGRHMDEVGAHVAGFNARSIGVCLVGSGVNTDAQWTSLKTLIEMLGLKFPGSRVCGHRDLSPDADGDGTVEPREWLKTCPNFEVETWLARCMVPEAAHIFPAPVREPA